jgi:hypothetical protein
VRQQNRDHWKPQVVGNQLMAYLNKLPGYDQLFDKADRRKMPGMSALIQTVRGKFVLGWQPFSMDAATKAAKTGAVQSRFGMNELCTEFGSSLAYSCR